MFHTAAAVRRRLDEAGFAYLPESKPWEVRRGGRYYTVRNNSSIIAFKVGAKLERISLPTYGVAFRLSDV